MAAILSPTSSGIATPVSVANGGTGDSSLTAFAVLAGGTSSTSPVQALASAGNSGDALVSAGAGVLPAFSGLTNSGLTAAGLGVAMQTCQPPPDNVQTLFSQQVVWMLASSPAAATVTKVGLLLARAGVTPDGTGINEMGIWTEAGSLQKATGDMTATFQTAVVGGYTAIEGTLTSSLALTANTNYYIGALTSFSGTTAQAATKSTGGLALSVINGHYLALTSAPATTTMPASFTPSGQTALGGIVFMWAR